MSRVKTSRVDLKAEVQRLQQWVNDLQSGMYINCVYCGHRYGPKESTPDTMADVLKRHVERCPKHPLFEFRNFVARALSGLRVIRTMLEVTKLEKGRARATELIEEAEVLLGHGAAHLPQGPGQFTEGDPGLPKYWRDAFADNEEVWAAMKKLGITSLQQCPKCSQLWANLNDEHCRKCGARMVTVAPVPTPTQEVH